MFALIPAAGHSTRMGCPKLALPLGGLTVLERVIAALRDAAVNPLVILAPHTAKLAAAAHDAMVLQLPNVTPHMRATVEHGLAYLAEHFNPPGDEPWLLVPADHPALDPALIRQLNESIRQRPNYSIAVPTFDGKRGHPALIRWLHWPAIRDFPQDEGLNKYLRLFANETLEMPVASPDVLLDLDTPVDYERLRKRFN